MPKRLSTSIISEMVRLRVEERLPLSAISARMGIAKSSASLVLRRHPLTKDEREKTRLEALRRSKAITAGLMRGAIPLSNAGIRGLTTVQKGEIAMLKCSLRAAELGFIISRPTIECRYDAVLDDGERLLRAQIKYCDRQMVGCSVHLGLAKRNGKTYSKAEIDIILIYLPSVDKVVRVGPESFDGKRYVIIRLVPGQNGRPGRNLDEVTW